MRKNTELGPEGSPKTTAHKKRIFLLFLGGVFLALFFIIWVLIAYSHSTVVADSTLEVLINSHQTPLATSLMVLASLYGREYFWVPVVALMLVFGKREMKTFAIELIILFIIGIISGEALKIIFFRERPIVALGSEIFVPPGVPFDTDSSFPSGHAIIVTIGASFILWKFLNHSHTIKAKSIALLLALEAGIVCYSRLYIGVHFPLDVAAGIVLGCAITLLVGYVLEVYLPSMLSRLAGVADLITRSVRIPEIF